MKTFTACPGIAGGLTLASSFLSVSSSFSAFPALSLGSHHFGGDFYVCEFFYPNIWVVTFRIRGWCVLGVLLLPAFTRLGHECQYLLSPCGGMHVYTHETSVYTLI